MQLGSVVFMLLSLLCINIFIIVPCVGETQHAEKLDIDTKKFAYVTYATNDEYACSSLIAAESITNTSIRGDIDIVILTTRNVSRTYIDRMNKLGYVTLNVYAQKSSAPGTDRTWAYSLTKLMSFGLTMYNRVVFLDSDSIVLKNMDHLFDLPPHFLYAPRAYWLDQPFFGSALLVIEPDKNRLFEILYEHKLREHTEKKPLYDMDILNSMFVDKVAILPPQYVILNGDFLTSESKVIDMDIHHLADETYVLHFSEAPNGSYGKPWESSDRHVIATEKSHPLYEKSFNIFWESQDRLCK